MNRRQATILNQIFNEDNDRATRTALIEEYARLEAQPVTAGTRVRTPWGIGVVLYPDAVPVRFDVPCQLPPTKIGLIPVEQLLPIENGTVSR